MLIPPKQPHQHDRRMSDVNQEKMMLTAKILSLKRYNSKSIWLAEHSWEGWNDWNIHVEAESLPGETDAGSFKKYTKAKPL